MSERTSTTATTATTTTASLPPLSEFTSLLERSDALRRTTTLSWTQTTAVHEVLLDAYARPTTVRRVALDALDDDDEDVPLARLVSRALDVDDDDAVAAPLLSALVDDAAPHRALLAKQFLRRRAIARYGPREASARVVAPLSSSATSASPDAVAADDAFVASTESFPEDAPRSAALFARAARDASDADVGRAARAACRASARAVRAAPEPLFETAAAAAQTTAVDVLRAAATSRRRTAAARAATAILLPALYDGRRRESADDAASFDARARALWELVTELLRTNDDETGGKRDDDEAVSIALGVLCVEHVLVSLLPRSEADERRSLLRAIRSRLSRRGDGRVSGRGRSHKDKAGSDDGDGGRDAADRESRRVAARALRWYVDARDDDDDDARGRPSPTTKAADRSRRRRRRGRDDKDDSSSRDSRLVQWRRYVACYETLESEGEQHLVDPVLPVVAGLCAAARDDDDEDEDEEDDDDYLPSLDWSWIGALLSRVFLSESPTVRKLALHRFLNDELGVRTTSSKEDSSLRPPSFVEVSYLPVLLRCLDSVQTSVGTVMQYVDAESGVTVAVNLAPRFRAFLATYLGALDDDRQEVATEWLLGGPMFDDVRPRVVVWVMESARALCEEEEEDDGRPRLRLSARATASCVDHLRRTLSAGGVPSDDRTALTEALAVILSRCSYGRDAGAAVDPELVLRALDLFVGTPTDEDVSVVPRALRRWIAGLGGDGWGAAAAAACAAAYVRGGDDDEDAPLTAAERSRGAAAAKLCALSDGAASAVWPAAHKGLMGGPRSRRAARACALLAAACREGAVGGSSGNGEVVVVRDGRTGRDVVPPPPPAVEELLTRACAAAVAQLELSTTTTTMEARAPKGSRDDSARASSTHFRSVASQWADWRAAFPTSRAVTETTNDACRTSTRALRDPTTRGRDVVRHAAVLCAALSCGAALENDEESIDACRRLLRAEYRDDDDDRDDAARARTQASRSVFQYAKWGAASLLLTRVQHVRDLPALVRDVAIDSVRAVPVDALLPLFDCCAAAVRSVNDRDDDVVADLADVLFAALDDTSNSAARAVMVHRLCVALFRPALMTREHQRGSDVVLRAFRRLVATAGTKRPRAARAVVGRAAAAWLGAGAAAIPYRQDAAELLLYKECPEVATADHCADEEEIQQGDEETFDIPLRTHPHSVVRGFVLVMLSKIPHDDDDRADVADGFARWILLHLLRTVCDVPPTSSTSVMTGSTEYCRRVRAWQALCCLARFVNDRLAEEVADTTLRCLSYNTHGQIRYFAEVFAIDCAARHPDVFGPRFVRDLTRADLSSQNVSSLMIVGGHLLVGDPKYSAPFRERVPSRRVLAGVVPWLSSTQGFSRAIAQLLVHALIPRVVDVDDAPDRDYDRDYDHDDDYLRSLHTFLDQNPETKRLRRKQTKFFARYKTEETCTVEGCLSIPVDGSDEADPPHLFNVIKQCLREVYDEAHETEAPVWRQVENAASPSLPPPALVLSDDTLFQRKIPPLDVDARLERALDDDRNAALYNAAGRPKRPLIVCAVLVDKVPNLAGLARTAEILAAERLVVADAGALKRDGFRAVSVGAEEHVDVEECRERNLSAWLRARREEGYAIVAVEQTSSSACVSEFAFAERTVLLLGREKEGVPVEYLRTVDACVEIPQFGIIRSLNVHVSGAITMWEYSKQMTAMKKR